MSEERYKVRRKSDGLFLVRPNACPPFNSTGRAYTTRGAARCAIGCFCRYDYAKPARSNFELVTYEIQETKTEAI